MLAVRKYRDAERALTLWPRCSGVVMLSVIALFGCPQNALRPAVNGAAPRASDATTDNGSDSGPADDRPVLLDRPVLEDVSCGLLGEPCCDLDGAATCVSGVCAADRCRPVPEGVACGLIGLACCEADAAMSCMSGVCSGGLCSRANGDCGRLGLACCGGTTCLFGLDCAVGRCVFGVGCGGNGAPCCDAGEVCGMGLACNAAGECEARPEDCGRLGQRCCDPPTLCARRFSCDAGFCSAP